MGYNWVMKTMKSIKTLALLLCITIGLIKVAIAQNDLTFTVNGVSFVMKPVAGGVFQMGAQKDNPNETNYDKEACGPEKPVHLVSLESFYMGETEVPLALWIAVMHENPNFFDGENQPVDQVSWDDCQLFIRRLNQLTGKNFRLPTEAEWEYAARGGRKSKGYKYSGGDDINNVGWFWKNSGDKYLSGRIDDGNPFNGGKLYSNNCRPHDVKGKSPNELGLYDMSGNVWEWCQDYWDYSYSSGSQTNPKGPLSGDCHVLRGGGWNSEEKTCRVSNRIVNFPGLQYGYTGFRLALTQ